ncbi:MAG: hypothetical protein ACK4UN_18715, partial [Limisphaerales bacterium]
MKRRFPFWMLVIIAVLQVNGAAASEYLKWEKLATLPDRVGVAAPFAGISSNALIVAGGANFPDTMPWEGGRKIWQDAAYVLPGPESEWKTGFKLPRPNGYGVSITGMGGLICIGGGDEKEHFRDVILLRWNGQELVAESLPPLPQGNAFQSGALLGNTIYIAGGIETPDGNTAWWPKAPAQTPRIPTEGLKHVWDFQYTGLLR